MNSFHGARKKRSYFEGWYLKQQNEEETIALIPAFHIDSKGFPTASLQIVTDEASHFVTFPAQDFQADPRRFCVQIAGNTFCEKGILLNLHTKQLSLTGKLRFGPFTPPISDIMGPFRFVPFLQCRHSVISLSHRVNGSLELNDKRYSFENGTGYLEGDRGRSFPAAYLWSQCNWQELGPCCVMLAVASIPFLGTSFTGCICSVSYAGREYRLATYCGAKVLQWSDEEAIIAQGDSLLQITLLEQRAHNLRAPNNGAMLRTIRESPSCRVRYRFLQKGKKLFDVTNSQASFEFSKNKS